MDSRKAKLSQFLTSSSSMLLNGETTNTVHSHSGFRSTLLSRTLGKLSFFPKPVGRFERTSWPAKSDSIASISSSFKTHVFGGETKLLQDVRHCKLRLLSL